MADSKKQILLIFDINNVLCCKVPRNRPVPGFETAAHRTGKFVIRPGLRAFMDYIFSEYYVGVYSSTSLHNLDNVMPKIFGKYYKDVLFTAHREHTMYDPEFGKDKSIKKYHTIKPLQYIWNNPIFNKDRIFGPSNTLLIDNSAKKTRLNDKRNVLVIKDWDLQSQVSIDQFTESIVKKVNTLIHYNNVMSADPELIAKIAQSLNTQSLRD